MRPMREFLVIILLAILTSGVSSFVLGWHFYRGGWGLSPILEQQNGQRIQTYSHICHNSKLAATVSSSESNKAFNVIYEKVFRPSSVLPQPLLLSSIIEYLEKHYKLPNDLPMVYETTHGTENDSFILAWDSPLSPSAPATRMELEIVGIYTDKRKSSTEKDGARQGICLPDMIMVAVKKAKYLSTTVPLMMMNLFEGSEKAIIRSLDRGLEDLTLGKIQLENPYSYVSTDPTTKPYSPATMKIIREAMEDESELIGSIQDPNVNRDYDPNVDIDDDDDDSTVPHEEHATDKKGVESRKPNPSPDKIAAAKATMEVKADQKPVDTATPKYNDDKTEHTETDFAVAAAKLSVSTKKKKEANVQGNNISSSGNQNDKRQKQNEEVLDQSTGSEVPSETEYAVVAARKKAAARKMKALALSKNTTENVTRDTTHPNHHGMEPKQDFAVEAARKRATTAKPSNVPKMEEKTSRQEGADDDDNDEVRSTASQQYPQDARLGNLPTQSKERAFRTTISRPGDRPKDIESLPNTSRSTAPKKEEQNKNSNTSESLDTQPTTSLKESNTSSEEELRTLSTPFATNRTLNIQVVDSERGADGLTVNPPKLETQTLKTLSEEDMHSDVMKATYKVMKELADQGQNMTPEELLEDVLAFDKKQREENEPGFGFVSGAMKEAKSLVRQRSSSVAKDVKLKEPDNRAAGESPKSPANLSEEEELRRMFKAGQQIADWRISRSLQNKDSGEKGETTEEDIDAIVAEDTTISRHARVLDEGLAELEIAIRSPINDDAPPRDQNNMFDIMTGPETYNPNVAPDAVNYPGAKPGTKKVALPRELKEAVVQAEFAANVLANMTTETTFDSNRQKQVKYFYDDKELSQEQVDQLRMVANEATELGLIQDLNKLAVERKRLEIVLNELWNQPSERFRDIASCYKDVLLSDNFVSLVQERLARMKTLDSEPGAMADQKLQESHKRERDLLGQLVSYTQALVKEAYALGAELEAQQLDIIRQICSVAMDPSHKTEEETAMALSDAVRDMRPLFDDTFIAYLKYAIAEEEGRLARAGQLNDPNHTRWLFILRIVQKGVYAEISKGINRFLEHIWYVIRMKTPAQRKQLLSYLIDDMPTLDVRPFVQVVENIARSLGNAVRGDFDGVAPLGEMTNKILQLRRDVKELLPPERIAQKARDADEWAIEKKKRLQKERQEGLSRLEAAHEAAERLGNRNSRIDVSQTVR